MDYISLNEFCDILSISLATGHNWIKLGKITPEYTDANTPFFTKEYANTLKSEIESGKNSALKSRRNKKYISGNLFYNSYVSEHSKNIEILQDMLNIADKNSITFDSEIIQYIVADCALHLLSQKYGYEEETSSLLLKYLNNKMMIGPYNKLIDAFIDNPDNAIKICRKYPFIFEFDYKYEESEDILGLIYLSCRNIGNRKAAGSYYTPTRIVKKLISNLQITENDKILDPCCGTGNFLLQLPSMVPFEKVYGNDIDNISVKITRLNMALKYSNISIDTIYEHITELNYLTDYVEKDFQYIIGNPPWGYDFSKDEKNELKKIYKCAVGKSIESFDIFIERALTDLSLNGELAFVLPEALLTVKAHTGIREIIMESNSIKHLDFLGNTFFGVQCPCIILQIMHTGKPLSTVGMNVRTLDKSFDILLDRNISSKHFSFLTTDAEYQILEKVKNISCAEFLADNSAFALGIVTGNNKEYLSTKKDCTNEIILKGSDICKYHVKPTHNYITFKPESFQQVAPTKMYRAPEKLLYRFISSQLVFAYDNNQTLSLNSCNIVIPKLRKAKIKYVLAILNSSVAQFIYRMEFNSVKVLRSHIESIPIPIVTEEIQDKIIEVTDLLIDGMPLENAKVTYEKLDQLIFDVFELTSKERNIVRSAVDNKNRFLK